MQLKGPGSSAVLEFRRLRNATVYQIRSRTCPCAVAGATHCVGSTDLCCPAKLRFAIALCKVSSCARADSRGRLSQSLAGPWPAYDGGERQPMNAQSYRVIVTGGS